MKELLLPIASFAIVFGPIFWAFSKGRKPRREWEYIPVPVKDRK